MIKSEANKPEKNMIASRRRHSFFVAMLFNGLLLAIGSVARADPPACNVLAREFVKEMTDVIQENDFTTGRDLAAYKEDFGTEFAADVDRLGPADHVYDMGSGKCLAIADYKVEGGEASVTGVTYRFESNSKTESLRQQGKMEVLEGRMLEDIPMKELHPASLITDYYGVMAYAPRVDLVLRRYLSLLKPGGVAYIHLGDFAELSDTRVWLGRGFSRAKRVIYGPNPENLSLDKWIATIPGIKVEYVQSESMVRTQTIQRLIGDTLQGGFFLKHRRSLRITTIDPAAVRIPTLDLVKSRQSGLSPVADRFYEVTGETMALEAVQHASDAPAFSRGGVARADSLKDNWQLQPDDARIVEEYEINGKLSDSDYQAFSERTKSLLNSSRDPKARLAELLEEMTWEPLEVWQGVVAQDPESHDVNHLAELPVRLIKTGNPRGN